MSYGWFGQTNTEAAQGEVIPEPPCPHGEVSLEEAVGLCIELYGGSWQTFIEKLNRRGVRLMRVKE